MLGGEERGMKPTEVRWGSPWVRVIDRTADLLEVLWPLPDRLGGSRYPVEREQAWVANGAGARSVDRLLRDDPQGEKLRQRLVGMAEG